VAVRRNIQVPTNADLELATRWKDSTGTPYDVTDALLQIRSTAESTNVLAEATLGNGRVVIDVDNWVRIKIPASALDTLNTQIAVYDLVVTRSDGVKKRLREGQAVITRGVSR